MPARELPDILLISVDSMRRDVMSPYGKNLMPTASRLLEEGTSFDNCFATSSWTGASFGSVHTGLWPRQHGCLSIKRHAGEKRHGSLIRKDVRMLAQMLQDRGYYTVCSQGNPCHVGYGSGFDRGFDQFFGWHLNWNVGRVRRELEALWLGLIQGKFGAAFSFVMGRTLKQLGISTPTVHWPMSDGESVTDKALSMIRQAPTEKPAFLWINYMDMHSPYPVPGKPLPRNKVPVKIRPFHEQPRTFPDVSFQEEDKIVSRLLYEMTAPYVDEQMCRLLDQWKVLRPSANCLTIFMSDHGEEFWDHGDGAADPWYYRSGVEHGHTFYNEVLQIPLVFHWPGTILAGQRLDNLASLIDITPTLIDLLQLEEDFSQMGGLSLANDLTASPATSSQDRIIFADSIACGLERQTAISMTHKFIRRLDEPEDELYEWNGKDPTEKSNLAGSANNASIQSHLSDALTTWNNSLEEVSAQLKASDEDKDLAERLEAMGYL